jgi:hypothetical protein
MRATDLIRTVLDLIDQIDQQPGEIQSQTPLTDDERRVQQIAGLLNGQPKSLANEPSEAYADVTAVTVNAGGGPNKPKHPADIRSNSVSQYPNFQARARR